MLRMGDRALLIARRCPKLAESYMHCLNSRKATVVRYVRSLSISMGVRAQSSWIPAILLGVIVILISIFASFSISVSWPISIFSVSIPSLVFFSSHIPIISFMSIPSSIVSLVSIISLIPLMLMVFWRKIVISEFSYLSLPMGIFTICRGFRALSIFERDAKSSFSEIR